jgi:hypothetical protein
MKFDRGYPTYLIGLEWVDFIDWTCDLVEVDSEIISFAFFSEGILKSQFRQTPVAFFVYKSRVCFLDFFIPNRKAPFVLKLARTWNS